MIFTTASSGGSTPRPAGTTSIPKVTHEPPPPPPPPPPPLPGENVHAPLPLKDPVHSGIGCGGAVGPMPSSASAALFAPMIDTPPSPAMKEGNRGSVGVLARCRA